MWEAASRSSSLPSSPGHSHSLRAQESVIEDGQTGEPSAVELLRTVTQGFVIVVKLQETGWITVGQSKAVYYSGKAENIYLSCFESSQNLLWLSDS